MTTGCFLPGVVLPQKMLKINTYLHQPGLLACGLLWAWHGTSLSTNQKLKTWARKMTNKKPRKYSGMVGGPDVQTKKMKHDGYLTERTNPGLAFGPLFTCKNWRNFNPSCRVNLTLGYPARGADPAWLLFSCKCLKTFDCKRVTWHCKEGSCKEGLTLIIGNGHSK